MSITEKSASGYRSPILMSGSSANHVRVDLRLKRVIESGMMPRELVISGAAGTGKTYPILMVLHCLATQEPGLRVLLVRLTRASLSESVLVTLEKEILPRDGYGSLVKSGAARQFRYSYRYPNSSELVCGGLDRPDKVMSTPWDIIFVNECREIEEGVWETLGTRLNRPGSKRGFGWLIGDTNPDHPGHWIRKREQLGKLELWVTNHESNPCLWDGKRWMRAGEECLARLDRLTGVRALRLRKGLWVGVEGQVYDEWDESVHVIDSFKIPDDWRRYRSIDFGYTNPFVCQWWAEDNDGRIYLYRELYGTQTLVSEWAEEIKRLSDGERIDWSVADHDSEDRATLECAGIRTYAAYKSVKTGIEAVQKRLRKSGDGKPRLFVLRDSLVKRDSFLSESGKPTCLQDEVSGYIWNTVVDGKPAKEEPRKLNDHACDAMRYLVSEIDGLGHYSVGAL